MTREELDFIGSMNMCDEISNEAYKKIVCHCGEQEPCDDMGEVSDGYHTFNQLYHQRAVLFATIVNQNKDKSWKSFKHSDGNYCFDSNGEWFIVGVDTPQGSYTYHYEKKYWDMFDCKELQCGKEWDGHTEEDVTRLLSLEQEPCEDAISRQAVLDCFTATKLKKFDFILYAREEIKNLPPVNPQPKTDWIPVSDRLPEDLEPVNITWVNHEPEPYYHDIKDKNFVATGIHYRDQWYWYSTTCADYLGEYGSNEIDLVDDAIEIVAWMPLPAPFEPQESEDN